RGWIEEYAHDVGVARQSLDRSRWQWHRELHLAACGPGHRLQSVHGRGDLDGGGLAAAGQLDSRVREALLTGAVVVFAHRLRQLLERGSHGRATDRVEDPVDQ